MWMISRILTVVSCVTCCLSILCRAVCIFRMFSCSSCGGCRGWCTGRICGNTWGCCSSPDNWGPLLAPSSHLPVCLMWTLPLAQGHLLPLFSWYLLRLRACRNSWPMNTDTQGWQRSAEGVRILFAKPLEQILLTNWTQKVENYKCGEDFLFHNEMNSFCQVNLNSGEQKLGENLLLNWTPI